MNYVLTCACTNKNQSIIRIISLRIKQLLRLHKQGESIKSIARHLCISKNTVKSYLGKLANGKLSIPELLELEDPVLEGTFHSGNPAYKDSRFDHLSNNLDYFSNGLKRVGVSKKLLWEEYLAVYPEGYAYSQFCFYLRISGFNFSQFISKSL